MLPAGEHDVSIEILGPAGTVVDVVNAGATIAPGQHSFLTRHWIAPVPVTKPETKSR